MKSTLTVAAFVVGGLLSSALPARAGLVDWMQEWSGPGPFHQGGSVLFTRCRGPFVANDDRAQNKPCVFFDTRRFIAEDGDNFPGNVTAFLADAGVTYRLRRAITIGMGAGLMTAKGSERASRMTITAPRVTVEPIMLVSELFGAPESVFVSHTGFWWRLAHTPKIYIRGNFILGRLRGEDLGIPGTTYDRTNEFVVSRGLMFDFAELIFRQ